MNNLAHLRKEKGLSQSDLARLVGVTRKYIFDLEKGKRKGIYVLARIAVVLDVPLNQLYVKSE